MINICRHFSIVAEICNKEKNTLILPLVRTLCYNSDLSLAKLYPQSNLRLYTPVPPALKSEKFNGYIPLDKIEISYSRSSGPGGQHVNRVNTKVDVRFNVGSADWISEKTRKRIIEEHRNKMNKEGYFVIRSDLTRTQHLNLADALEKLRRFIRELEVEVQPPTEETLEKARRRHERASRERLMIKRHRSQIKLDRQAPSIDASY